VWRLKRDRSDCPDGTQVEDAVCPVRAARRSPRALGDASGIGDDNFALGVSCLQVGDRFAEFTEQVGSVDHGVDLPLRDEALEECHVVSVEGFHHRNPIFFRVASEISRPQNRQAKILGVVPPRRT
jgi:hypothetical protein